MSSAGPSPEVSDSGIRSGPVPGLLTLPAPPRPGNHGPPLLGHLSDRAAAGTGCPVGSLAGFPHRASVRDMVTAACGDRWGPGTPGPLWNAHDCLTPGLGPWDQHRRMLKCQLHLKNEKLILNNLPVIQY